MKNVALTTTLGSENAFHRAALTLGYREDEVMHYTRPKSVITSQCLHRVGRKASASGRCGNSQLQKRRALGIQPINKDTLWSFMPVKPM